ncbi:MAG: hypothetical protein WKF97_10770 [Chitinophagaceae bacterium]
MAKSKKETNLNLHDQAFSGGSTVTLQPASFDPVTVTPEMLSTMINSDVKKPSWKLNKYPVDLATFREMQKAAEQPDESTGMSLESADGAASDTDQELAFEAVELPEDGDFGPDSPAALAPPVNCSFEAIPSTGWIPPDCVCAAGPSHIVVAVNSEFRIYNKTGGFLRRTPAGTFFSPALPNNPNVKVFDPRIVYDDYSNRFLMIYAATQSAPARSWCLVAVSKTSDPMGAWWLYALDAAVDGSTVTTNWMDYPMLGFDPNAVYIGMNQFKVGGGFQYAKLRILNKTELYAGLPVRWWDFWNLKNPDGSGAFTVQPCCHYRGVGAGSAYLINAIWPASNKLTLWTLANPLAHWSGGAPTLSKVSVNCRAYDLPPQAKQSGTTTTINTNDSRLLNAIYQNSGGVQRIWTAHTAKISWSGDAEARSAVQWYEIDVPTKAVIQQNGYGQSGTYYFFPAIQTDVRRNAYIVFGRSSASEFANLRITGRKVTGPLNDMENSALIKAGESAHTSGRYGDYFGIGRDGADANRIVGVGEYAESSGNWGTWVFCSKY